MKQFVALANLLSRRRFHRIKQPGHDTLEVFDIAIIERKGEPIKHLVSHRRSAPDANAMGYYGSSGLFELKGAVGPAIVSPAGTNIPLARRPWAVSEELTDVHRPISN